jgi:hypothetical protein
MPAGAHQRRAGSKALALCGALASGMRNHADVMAYSRLSHNAISDPLQSVYTLTSECGDFAARLLGSVPVQAWGENRDRPGGKQGQTTFFC